MTKGKVVWTLEDEVAWGEREENRIMGRWAKTSSLSPKGGFVTKSPPYADFDFCVLTKVGFPVAWVEVKLRRSPLARFGDALFPLRKHERAKELWEQHKIKLIGITEYGCGSLVEVDLSVAPTKFVDIKRRDRTGPAKPHVIYEKDKIRVLKGVRQ